MIKSFCCKMPTTIINKFWLLCCLPFSPRGSRQHCNPPSSLHTNTLTKQIHRHTISATFLAFCRMRNSPESTSRTRPSETPFFFLPRHNLKYLFTTRGKCASVWTLEREKKFSKSSLFFYSRNEGRWQNKVRKWHRAYLLFIRFY